MCAIACDATATSGDIGRKMPTRSPGSTPSETRCSASRVTSRESSANVSFASRCRPRRARPRRCRPAGDSAQRCTQLCAMFSVAPTNQVVHAGPRESSSTCVQGCENSSPMSSIASGQNQAGSSCERRTSCAEVRDAGPAHEAGRIRMLDRRPVGRQTTSLTAAIQSRPPVPNRTRPRWTHVSSCHRLARTTDGSAASDWPLAFANLAGANFQLGRGVSMQRFVTDENKKWFTLAAVSVGLFMIMLDNTVVNVALPSIRSSLAHGDRGARMGGRRLRAHLRRVHADRRQAGRLRRPAPDLHDRPRGLHRCESSPAGSPERQLPHRRARRARPRRRADEPGDALDHHGHVRAARARQGDRHLGRRLGARARDRPARRRPARPST